MSDAPDPQVTGPDPRPRGRKRRVLRSILTGVLGAAFVLLVLAWALVERPLSLPDGLRDRVETAVNAGAATQSVSIGGIDLVVGRDRATRAVLRNVAVRDAGGVPLAAFAQVRARLSPAALWDRRIAPTAVAVAGVEITLRRQPDGRLSVVGQGQGGTADDALSALSRAMASPPFDQLQRVSVEDLTLTLEDARTGRVWQATGGQAVLRREGQGLTLSLGTDLFNGTDALARVELNWTWGGDDRAGDLGVRLTGLPARDIAAQAPSMAWLAALDAPISGAVRARVGAGGALETLAGTLDIAKGALSPGQGAKPQGFDSATSYFSFDRARNRVAFSQIGVRAAGLDVEATGHVYLDELKDGWPQAFLGQITVDRIRLAEGPLPSALDIDGGHADLRLRLDPFTVEVAQLTVRSGATTARARGRVSADAEGWHVTLDANAARVETARVLSLWPEAVGPGTRRWLSENVGAGVLTDTSFGLRAESGAKPQINLTFGFEGAEVRALQSLPVITGRGFGSLIDGRLGIEVTEGVMDTPEGPLTADGTTFAILDTRDRPRLGEVVIAASGDAAAALWVIDQPPFRILDRAGRPRDIATGEVDVRAAITFPVKRGIRGEELDYDVTGRLTGVASDQLVPGRTLAADALTLQANPRAVSIFGPATLDGVAVEANWTQPIGPDAGPGTVKGRVALDNAVLETFGVSLADGMVTGRGNGRFEVTLAKDAAPQLELTSDMAGIGLSLPQLSWSKRADRVGEFLLSMTLGEGLKVDRLALSAAGLDATGQVLFDQGAFAKLGLSRLRVGGWLDAQVDLVPGANGIPDIAVRGGRFDLRNLPDGGGGGGQGAGSGGRPIDVSLDELIVTDGIRISPIRGRMTPARGGIEGSFTGLLGGRTPVATRLTPAFGGTALRARSEDAGGALRDAGLSESGRGGVLDLVMTPVSGSRGWYDGEFRITDMRLRDAPAMVGLLDAISVVGVLDQARGPGIAFDTIDGRFRLGPDRLRLTEAAAVGPSLGVSADGVFDLENKVMSLQGVVSPVYFLNGIGSILTRRGEGLFGFNYRMSGAVDAPSVGVNPLSIFTPGMFREIFRAQPSQ